eukprot:gene58223-biopygen86674
MNNLGSSTDAADCARKCLAQPLCRYAVRRYNGACTDFLTCDTFHEGNGPWQNCAVRPPSAAPTSSQTTVYTPANNVCFTRHDPYQRGLIGPCANRRQQEFGGIAAQYQRGTPDVLHQFAPKQH